MSKLNQKEAVYNAVKKVTGKDHNEGDVLTLTKDQKSEVRSLLVTSFENNEVELKSAQDDIKKYVNSLLNNWLRKDKRFNGGETYVIKNKGSRTGQSDAMVKNLRLLLKKDTLTESERTDIQEAINTRLDEIAPTKKIEVDANVIPAELQHLL